MSLENQPILIVKFKKSAYLHLHATPDLSIWCEKHKTDLVNRLNS